MSNAVPPALVRVLVKTEANDLPMSKTVAGADVPAELGILAEAYRQGWPGDAAILIEEVAA